MGEFQYLGLWCPKHTEKHVSAKSTSYFCNDLTNALTFKSNSAWKSGISIITFYIIQVGSHSVLPLVINGLSLVIYCQLNKFIGCNRQKLIGLFLAMFLMDKYLVWLQS